MVIHDSTIAQMAPRLATIRKGRISAKENARA
jgi:putative ABC transport system ATP-binding protein